MEEEDGKIVSVKVQYMKEFFIFLKIQDDHGRSKVQNRPNFTPQITFFAITWIRFIRFRQNLAWTYYLTLGTSLRKNFGFLRIQDGRRWSKVQNRPNFTPQITFWLIIWIRFIRFEPNLAGRYYSTQGTSLRKNF